MSALRTALGHVERTVSEPRQIVFHQVVLSKIVPVNINVRLLQLSIPNRTPFKFLPGQWLDVHIPGLSQVGGFTITSTPKDAEHSESTHGFLELAIQKSPRNPPAAWLWRPTKEILGSKIVVKIGGTFVWPPSWLEMETVRRLVLVAGGVGINPLISILAHLYNQPQTHPSQIRLLYTTRSISSNIMDILFYERIKKLLSKDMSHERTLDLFLTSSTMPSTILPENQSGKDVIRQHHQRISHQDLIQALGPEEERGGTVAYVCGPPGMTDGFVNVLRDAGGMNEKQVLCEKWW